MRFAHQCLADSRESIHKKIPIFEALGQIRANRVFSPIRIEIRVLSSLLSIFGKVDSQKKGVFEARIDSQRRFAIRVRIANRFARIGPLRAGHFQADPAIKSINFRKQAWKRVSRSARILVPTVPT